MTDERARSANEIDARPMNWLVPVTLVLLRECSSYGYELMQHTMEFGFQALNPGTLYRALRKMEKDGLCKSDRETASGGPARRMYSITDAGLAYLDLWVESLESCTGRAWTPFSEPTGAVGSPPRK